MDRPSLDPRWYQHGPKVPILLAFLLLVSCSYFWQARGWNHASRLALTYSLGDRGTICIDGLQAQTRDLACIDGHYYCDKPPGQSWLGALVYTPLRPWLEAHPLDGPQLLYWWPDYVITSLTSGLATALLGVLVYLAALQGGCGQRWAVVVSLSCGLATPLFTYGTLFFGHNTAALMTFAAYLLLRRADDSGRWSAGGMLTAGLLAGYGVLTEYQVIGTSACVAGYAFRACPKRRLLAMFVLGAGACAIAMCLYHEAAFGGLFQLGYFHEADPQFQAIYSREHPVGLQCPTGERAINLLFSPHGLLWYAPVLALVPCGVWLLARRQQWREALFVIVPGGCLFVLNASHPTWWGGWTTGPRYLVPIFPFLFLSIAAVAARPGRLRTLIAPLSLAGYVVCLLCTAWRLGGCLPDFDYPGGDNPLVNVLWPDVRDGSIGPCNAGNVLLHGKWHFPARGNWMSLLPLINFQVLVIWLIMRQCAPAARPAGSPPVETADQGVLV
jgi:hypothetical protein